MSKTYKTRYGFDWPVDMPDELIGDRKSVV